MLWCGRPDGTLSLVLFSLVAGAWRLRQLPGVKRPQERCSRPSVGDGRDAGRHRQLRRDGQGLVSFIELLPNFPFCSYPSGFQGYKNVIPMFEWGTDETRHRQFR
jgi:hypothetical protein